MSTEQPRSVASSAPVRVEDLIRDVEDVLYEIRGLSHYIVTQDFLEGCYYRQSRAQVAPLDLPTRPTASPSDPAPGGSASKELRKLKEKLATGERDSAEAPDEME
ncbi:hypothetical protein AK830_g12129 [Neonectria ditissima]|uniref:Uncharacterized protein n=1 Tax=Neonectria ditissima TaxID=78410 RepID=A0A0P7B139_9HYPO|nr:hypothetical protein AK830_g12129 [Neonectria ditissima]